MRFTLGIILGGAIGNFIDRVRLGYVIDFIDWHWYSSSWPTFNVADSAISVGVVLLVIEMIREEKRNAQQSEDSQIGPTTSYRFKFFDELVMLLILCVAW